jgi:hypothetical protein
MRDSEMMKLFISITMAVVTVGCVSRMATPAAIVMNDEHGIAKCLTLDQLRRLDNLVQIGLTVANTNNLQVWHDDEIWYRVFVNDEEGCYRLKYAFHPSFRKIKAYPERYVNFPDTVDEGSCLRIVHRAEPDFVPFDEEAFDDLTELLFPDESWSGFGRHTKTSTKQVGGPPLPPAANRAQSPIP